MEQVSRQAVRNFQTTVWHHYAEQGRYDLPWRQPNNNGRFDPYKIAVSEFMLQQTQVSRVIPKYEAFLRQFPTVGELASAELGEVIRAWNGLGYNRRASYLWQTAKVVHREGQDTFPDNVTKLVKLPGIGINTAGAIVAYAFNAPVVFLETNIRTAVIHHFFPTRTQITEADIRQVVSQVVDVTRPREWYWALMDYGSFLKRTVGNLNKLSKSYAKQSPFESSKRQVRGTVLRTLSRAPATTSQLQHAIRSTWLPEVLDTLVAEGLIRRSKTTYHL